MKTINALFILAMMLLVSCNSSDRSGKLSGTNIGILIDKTTFEKEPDAVDKEVKKVASEILKKMQGEKRADYLGSIIKLGVIDGKGEHDNLWEIKVSDKFGKHNSSYKKSLIEFQTKITDTMKSLKTEAQSHQASWILEPIVKELKKLKDGDELYIVSDMMIVDDKNNFEKLQFSNPPNLSNFTAGKNIYPRRVSLGGKNFQEISAIEAWWESAFSGNNESFQKALAAYEQSHPKKEIENNPQPKENKNSYYAKKKLKENFHTKIASNSNDVFSQYASAFRRCYRETSPSKANLYMEISISEDGSVSGLSFPRANENSDLAWKGCVQTVLLDMKFSPEDQRTVLKKQLAFAQN